MPSLNNHQSNEFVKLLAIGNSKTGKTGSLASLVKAGYRLRILDLDNLLDILKYILRQQCPALIENVEYRTIRDLYKTGPTGVVVDGKPKAWDAAIRMCDRWKYDDVDLGPPAEWGPDCILVIDSLSRLCDAAFNWHEAMMPRSRTGDFDGRAVYRNAQDDVEKFLAALTSPAMRTNLIVVAHITFQTQINGAIMGFPQGVGQKLSPKIPTYFPSVVLYSNHNGKRMLQTNSAPLMDLANPRPFQMQPTYPIETGLADFFAVLRPAPHLPEGVNQRSIANAKPAS